MSKLINIPTHQRVKILEKRIREKSEIFTLDANSCESVPDFSEHISYGWISHLSITVIILPVLYVGEYSTEIIFAIAGISLPLVLFASVLPDIDHHSSKTNKLFKFSLTIFVITIVSSTLSQYMFSISLLWMTFIYSVPAYLPILSVAVVSLVAGVTSSRMYKIIRPNHRGITHTVRFTALITLLIGIFTWQTQRVFFSSSNALLISVLISAYFLTGMLSHLIGDRELKFFR